MTDETTLAYLRRFNDLISARLLAPDRALLHADFMRYWNDGNIVRLRHRLRKWGHCTEPHDTADIKKRPRAAVSIGHESDREN